MLLLNKEVICTKICALKCDQPDETTVVAVKTPSYWSEKIANHTRLHRGLLLLRPALRIRIQV